LPVKKKTVRSGIVGAGFAAGFHVEALKKVHSTNVEIKGIYSPNRAKKFAGQHGIGVYDSLEALLQEVDIIHCCTIASAHESVAVAALKQDKSVIVEKPLTGFFGDGTDRFHGETYPKQKALEQAQASVKRMLDAEETSQGRILYAENWVYAPAIQKEREIIEKTGAQILWMHGEESHSGSHSPAYGSWKFSGGGSAIGKGCHPLAAALYLKSVEGKFRGDKSIRPKAVSARTHALTRMENFEDKGHLRTEYQDVEDFSLMHVVFEDNTIADIFSSELVLGGVHNWLEVAANNHRTVCNINPNNTMQIYNPVDSYFEDIYVVEKIGTKQGWSSISPDEGWFTGYQQEMEAFYQSVAYGGPVESDSRLAADCISTIYSGYVSAEKAGAEVAVKLL
jgi:predicted dehydrogenase